MKTFCFTLLLLCLSTPALAQNSTLNIGLKTQSVDATRTADVTIRIIVTPAAGSTLIQAELDQALFRAFADLVLEVIGEPNLCQKAGDGTCLKDGRGNIVYDSTIMAPLIRKAIKRDLNRTLIRQIEAEEQAKASPGALFWNVAA